MFTCCTMEDLITIIPKNFDEDVEEQLIRSIKIKYINKIIPNVGCSLAFCELLEYDQGFILHNDGSSYHNSIFKIIVYRPLVGEILQGRISRSSKGGIFVQCQQFYDILVPPRCMPSNMEYMEDEQVWVWAMDGQKSWLDSGEDIRIKVEKEEFCGEEKKSGYLIIASINGDGLGLTSWWED
eukprot:NODE_309_length_11266_cov_0.459479.p6 type:complete len:182 gc:universal NODE_309_length_11266_cov_0.459479:3079-3624(+)